MQDDAPRQFRELFSELPLFDDFYLQMQATNLDIMDDFIEAQETELLRRYIDIERTPVPEALFVSAISQLWIFGMYELLRTWRQRVEEICKFSVAYYSTPIAKRQTFARERRKKVKELGKHALGSPWTAFAKAVRSVRYLGRLQFTYDQSELAFRRIEALRISLAKHEIPKSKGALALAPGYDRIDMRDGSIYWQIVLDKNEIDIVSRRRIAEECRAFPLIPSKLILPRPVQKKLTSFPKHSYGTKRTRVILRNGQNIDGVIVAWDKLIAFIEGGRRRFDARRVIDVISTPQKLPKMKIP